ncbi:sialidase family protein [Azohydromonas lata]|uniref:exo-alpha-sialidase n=1 Tax=Azohydromonas lata TaxID=45677 RepID=A0ABU5IPV3_9BURK|nr:sialidase family protein [Azohydromonas lata]MDZ5460907.1 sialidase family protein [Azohydromonas lata]
MSRKLWCLRMTVVRAGLAITLMKLGAAAAQAVVPISGLSPNPDGGNPNDAAAVTRCNGAPQTGVLYRNSESEPHLAVNPLDRNNLIAGWHQDRWSTGGAQSLGAAYSRDGGQSWTRVVIPFTRCAGAQPGSSGDYERASDPWISFGPTGTAYFMALSIDRSSNENAMLVSRSTDQGASWSPPTVIVRQPAQDAVQASVSHDKNSLLADPYDARRVYAAWTVFRTGVTSLVFSRSTDGGRTWSPPAPIATMGSVARSALAVFRQGAQMAVLPDGTLVSAFFRIVTEQRSGATAYEQVLLRSVDQGRHWSRRDIPVSVFGNVTARDVELGIPVRDAEGLPSLAVNRRTGALYMAWQDSRFNSLGLAGIAIARSVDGGLTWSGPVRANPGADNRVQAFLPTVAVNDDGTVGVLFYDFRNDVAGDAPLSTDVHLSLFDAGLNYLDEKRLTPSSFDLRQMVLTGARGFFPGDYMGLSSAGADFVAAFTRSNDLGLPVLFPQDNSGVSVDAHDRQSIMFVRQAP